jgi:toxin HigB-1
MTDEILGRRSDHPAPRIRNIEPGEKLRYLNAAGDLGDLSSPPGNRLEALAGGRKGQHSIRINNQFRVCFVWTAEGPAEVEIVDYH